MSWPTAQGIRLVTPGKGKGLHQREPAAKYLTPNENASDISRSTVLLDNSCLLRRLPRPAALCGQDRSPLRLDRHAPEQTTASTKPPSSSSFSVFEGLYEDGLSNEDLDRILLKEKNQAYFHFIYACPICTATIWGLEAYRSRPDRFYGLKGRIDLRLRPVQGTPPATLQRRLRRPSHRHQHPRPKLDCPSHRKDEPLRETTRRTAITPLSVNARGDESAPELPRCLKHCWPWRRASRHRLRAPRRMCRLQRRRWPAHENP